jgi:hypothetical protein
MLYLSNNQLERIVLNAPNLKTLYLSKNKLSDLSNIIVPELEVLIVEDNLIVKLLDFSSSSKLITLNANNNLLSELPDNFYDLENIKTVYLNNGHALVIDNKISKMLSIQDLRIGCKKRKYVYENHMLIASSNDPEDYTIDDNITHFSMFGKYDEQVYHGMDDDPVWYEIIDAYTQINFLDRMPINLKYLKLTGLEVPIRNLPVLLETLVLCLCNIDIDLDVKLGFGVELIIQ